MLSIILVNYNNTFHTIKCLKSLQSQIFKNFEIIIVENNSNENNKKKFYDFLKSDELQQNFIKKIKIINSNKNLGFTGGNNLGIKKSNRELLLLLNSDTFHEPDFLKLMINFFKKYKSVHIAQPKICFYPNKDIIWANGGKINKFSIKLFPLTNYLERNNDQIQKPFRIDYAVGCAIFIRRKILMNIGLLDRIFFMYGGDSDLCYRATQRGYNVFCNPKAKIYHNITIEKSDPYKKFQFRNRNIWCLKNFPYYIVIWQFCLQFSNLLGHTIDFKKKRIDYAFFFKSIIGIIKGLKIGIKIRIHNKSG